MVAAVFDGPFSFLLFILVVAIYVAFKLVQTACTDSTAGQAIRGICHRWFGTRDDQPQP